MNNSGKVNFFRMESAVDTETNIEEIYDLQQNVPNPSVGSTIIQYMLKKAGNVKISVYNLNGQLIRLLD